MMRTAARRVRSDDGRAAGADGRSGAAGSSGRCPSSSWKPPPRPRVA